MAQQFGLIAVLNNNDIEKRDQARAAEASGEPQGDPYANLVQRIGGYIESCWQAAKTAKEGNIEPDMLEDLRQREGEYSPTKLAAIKEQGGSEIFMMLTNMKCRAAVGWLRDTLLPHGERPFATKPSPVPDSLPDEFKQSVFTRTMQELQEAIATGLYPTQEQVYERSRELYDHLRRKMMEEAKARAQRMESCIDDVLVEGEWYEAVDSMLPDMVTYPAAFLKGPVVRKTSRLKWVQGPDGRSVPQATDELVPMFYSPSPFDIYPAPDSRGINDGYLFERMSLRRSAIHRMIGVPGYKEEAIRAALEEYSRKGHDLSAGGDQTRRDLENSPNWQMTPDHAIDAYEFHGAVRGEWLLEWGMPKKQIPDPDADYEVTALKIGRFIIRCVLNDDPLRRRPYEKVSYDDIKGQFWGRGLPRLIKDCQDICNAAARAIVNNMGMSSGPMMEVEVDRLAEGEDVTSMYPWRIIQTKASKTTPGAAVRWFMPPSVTRELLDVYARFSALADNYSGIPQFEQGVNPTAGAAGTASGLSMLMGSASRLVKGLIAGIDRCIKGSVIRTHAHIMLFMPEAADARGDANIMARGSSSLVAKEQLQLRRAEFVQATANPIDMQIIGPLGRAELLRDTMRTLDYNVDDIIPPKDEMLARQKAEQMMQQQMIQAQAMGQPGQPGKPPAMNPAGQPAGGADHALMAA